MSNQESTDRPAEPTTADQSASGNQDAGAAAAPPPPPPHAEESAGSGSGSDNKGLMLILSYLWILALIPLLVEKDDADVQWHAKNGLVWTVAEFLTHVVLFPVGLLISFVLAVVPSILSTLSIGGCAITPILLVGWIVVRVMAVMKALKGERMRLPVLSNLAEKF